MRIVPFLRRFWLNLPLRTKLAGFTGLLVLSVVVTLTLLAIQRERESSVEGLELQARLALDLYSYRLGDPLYSADINQIQQISADLQDDERFTRFKVYGPDGELWVDSRQPGENFPADVDPPDADLFLRDAGDPKFSWDWDRDELIAGQGVSILGGRVGAVEMGFSTRPLEEKITELTAQSTTLAAVSLVIGISLAALVAGQLTHPIGALTRTANKMAAGDLSTRFPPQGGDEIRQLGRAFNDMATAIEKRETDLRNLAHSLEQAVKERTVELQQQNQYLEALHEVTLGLIEKLDGEPLLEAIITRAATLAETEHAFVSIFERERGELLRRAARGRYIDHLKTRSTPGQGLSWRVMETGQMIILEDYQEFDERNPEFDWLRSAIYVPLRSGQTILGVIGLGYDKVVPVKRGHVDILNQFGQLASLAWVNAQLYSATREELTKKVQALIVEEERRKAYLASPQGQAELMVESILQDPGQGLVRLHELAQQSEEDATAAIILPQLKGAFEKAGQPMLARVAEGYQDIQRSKLEWELLTVGLRTLIDVLGTSAADSLQHADEAASVYRLCRQAIEAQSINAITEQLPELQAIHANRNSYSILAELAGVLQEFVVVAQSLHAYERVETTEDRMAYLGSAAEKLSHADRVVHSLRAADRPIARRIVERWRASVTGAMTDLQRRAKISARLLTRHAWQGDVITLALRLRNDGQGMALNLRLSPVESAEYDFVDEDAVIDRLATGEEAQVELRVRPKGGPKPETMRVRFVVLYDDPRGPNQVEHFADLVHPLPLPAEFQFIPNPYVAGTPLEAGSPLFVGREDIFNFIEQNLSASHPNNLVLIGQRRTGKSSLLKQLPLRLGDAYLPVYVDGQSVALDPGLPAFYLNLATEIGEALEERGFHVSAPDVRKFSGRPAQAFEHDFLRRVRTAIGARHLVLLLDEFEELEAAARSGHLDASVFGFLRHLIQHETGLSVIFCGTHRIEELATDYFGVLFNISLYKHVGFLEEQEALRLIQEPVARYGMQYDDLALDKIWRVTAGHPYFLQLLCHSLVNRHNRNGRSYVTVEDVTTALDEILSAGEAHFIYLWNESSLAERQVLTALSRMMQLTGRATTVQVEDYLAERGVPLDRHGIGETLQHLTLREILAMQVDSHPLGVGGTYQWRLGLLGLWIEKYRSLSLVQEEAHR